MAYRVDDPRLLNKRATVQAAGFTTADQYDTRLHALELALEELTVRVARFGDEIRDLIAYEVERLERGIEGEALDPGPE
jgi:hypothetical protein